MATRFTIAQRDAISHAKSVLRTFDGLESDHLNPFRPSDVELGAELDAERLEHAEKLADAMAHLLDLLS